MNRRWSALFGAAIFALAACSGGGGGNSGGGMPPSGGATQPPAPTASPTAAPTASPTTSPTATPTASPTASPTATPTATPTAAPTASPTASPTSTPTTGPSYACDNASFLSKQSAYLTAGSGADVEENVCGTVTQVLAEKHTSSGNHGYFYVQVAPGDTIEIVSNLDAMSGAATSKPPATWPWVSVGQYAYVKGRYYFDNAGSQGIDWTEDDTGSWPNTGYVVICASQATSCNFYW